MGVVLGGVVRIPLKLSFVIPSTYHLLLLLDKHWLLAPKPCQSCCSCGSKWAATTNFTPCLVVSNQRFFLRKFVVKGWFSRFFCWVISTGKKVEIHHTIRMMKTVEFMQIPLKLESTTDDVGIFMDVWFFLSQVITWVSSILGCTAASRCVADAEKIQAPQKLCHLPCQMLRVSHWI